MQLWSFLISLFSPRDKRLPYRPRPWWRRLPRLSLIPLLLSVIGCEQIPVPPSWRPALEQTGLIEPVAPEPIVLDGICDTSLGSPCSSKETFRLAVRATAEVVVTRPGSILRWTLLATSLEQTRHLPEKVSPPVLPRSPRAQAEARERFIREATDYYVAAAETVFTAKALRASPLTATVGQVAVADTHGIARRLLLVVSDARDVSDLIDLECLPTKRFPQPEAWARQTARLIPTSSLAGAQVFFAFMTVSPTGRTGRCPAATVERVLATQELWRAALSRAGAERTVFANGMPELVPAAGTALVTR